MHEHHHHAGNHSDRRRLGAALLLSAGYMLAEVVGGWWSGSLALLADAGHMLSDTAALGLSLFAAWIVTRAASVQQTFGYLRAEILAAVVNGAMLVAVSFGIAWEAWERFQDPQHVSTGLMGAIALGGLVVNLLMLRVLHGGDHDNLNMRGAWLHALGDTLGSLGVLIAAGLTSAGWPWADPAVSVLISLLILYSAGRLLSDSVAVLMEQSPRSINVDAVRESLARSEGVRDVHCLHVWSISSGFHSVSAHVVLEPGRDPARDLSELTERLKGRFGLRHVTLQLEPEGFGGCEESECLNSGEGCREGDVPHDHDGDPISPQPVS
jgi:cobalt-zinc-cadmium efflux system protein